jgi:hypothetical protein
VSRRFVNVLHFHRPRPATVLAALALLVSLSGNAAAALVITSNSQVGPATIAGHHPPSGDHSNLVAGSVNGTDVADNSLTGADINAATLSGIAHKLYFDSGPSSNPPTRLATVGPWAIKAECTDQLNEMLIVNGPGGAQVGDTRAEDDANHFDETRGIGLAAGTDTAIVITFGPSGEHFERKWGTIVLNSSTTVAEIDFDSVADSRTGLDHCFLYGTVTLGV